MKEIRRILAKEVYRQRRVYGMCSYRTFNDSLIDKACALVKDWSIVKDCFVQPKTGEFISSQEILMAVGGRHVFGHYYGYFNGDWKSLQYIEDRVFGITDQEREAITLKKEIEEFEEYLQFGDKPLATTPNPLNYRIRI